MLSHCLVIHAPNSCGLLSQGIVNEKNFNLEKTTSSVLSLFLIYTLNIDYEHVQCALYIHTV